MTQPVLTKEDLAICEREYALELMYLAGFADAQKAIAQSPTGVFVLADTQKVAVAKERVARLKAHIDKCTAPG